MQLDKSPPVAEHHDRERWLQARTTSVGSSEVPAIFGESPFATARDVWMEKVGERTPEPPQETNPDRLRGKLLEPVAVELFVRATGRQVRRWPHRKHPTVPVLSASIDRQIFAQGDLPTAALEAKVPRYHVFQQWKKEGLPSHVILQMQTEAIVLGYEATFVSVLHADSMGHLTFEVPVDPELARAIPDRIAEWWETYVVRRVPPPLEGAKYDLPKDAVLRAGEEARPLEGNALEAALDYHEARQVAKAAEEARKQAGEILKASLEPGVMYELEGILRSKNSEIAGRNSFDAKALTAVKPLDPIKVLTVLDEYGISPATAVDILTETALDLAPFWKQGAGYQQVGLWELKQREEG